MDLRLAGIALLFVFFLPLCHSPGAGSSASPWESPTHQGLKSCELFLLCRDAIDDVMERSIAQEGQVLAVAPMPMLYT